MTQPAEERLVSIIVPVYNAQDTLERCLLPLRAEACWRPDRQDMSRLRRHLPRYILTAQAPRGYKLLSLSLAVFGSGATSRMFKLLHL